MRAVKCARDGHKRCSRCAVRKSECIESEEGILECEEGMASSEGSGEACVGCAVVADGEVSVVESDALCTLCVVDASFQLQCV